LIHSAKLQPHLLKKNIIKMRFFFCSLLFLLAGYDSIAQDSLAIPKSEDQKDTTDYFTSDYTIDDVKGLPDSSNVVARSFDLKKLTELKNNEDFDYRQPPTVAESLWDRFMGWLREIISWIFRGAAETAWGRIIVYALGIALVTIIVMMLLKVDTLKVFFSGADKGSLNYETFHENIHEMNFEKLIQEALDKKEFRLGIRLTFLYALKLLSDKQHVDWRPGKTNHDYIEELKKTDLKIGFNELSFYFNHAWYGEFTVNEIMYQRVRLIFDTWRKKIQ